MVERQPKTNHLRNTRVRKNENKRVSNEEEVEYICKIEHSYIYIFDGRERQPKNKSF